MQESETSERRPPLLSNDVEHGDGRERETKEMRALIVVANYRHELCNKSMGIHHKNKRAKLCLISLGLETVLIRRAPDSLSLFVAVEDNFTLILNELTIVVALPKRVEGITIIISVMLADEGLEILRSFLAIVEGHLREEVVDDVVVGDIV